MERGNLEVASVRADLQDKTALARIGAAEDNAGQVAFWSDDSHFVTGQSLNVDGGIIFS